MIFEPGGDGDGMFGMPLITLGIVIDDDAFLEISSKERDVLCQFSQRRKYLDVR
jgi:hypothetical protein